MNPNISNIIEEGDILKFTLSGLNVSLANALRRTILSDIPTLAFYTETYVNNDCNISVNTTRLHNEILKHRLSCIPIHMKELDLLPGTYVLDLDVKNDTENMLIVTTEHFKIRNKTNGNFLTVEEVRKIFPPCQKTNMYIDFARLRPKIGDSIPGEQLKLTAEFSVHTAKENGMYNVVSKCAYGNTLDAEKIKDTWEEYENKLRADETPNEDIEFQKRNFYMLDAQRHYKENSYDFVLQTIGVYDNIEIVKKACAVLQNKLVELVQSIDSDIVPILNSETTIDNCYDIILENEDYTIGKVLEYILYEKYYVNEKILSFCGFKKFHPHNDDSTIRVAYIQPSDKRTAAQHLRISCMDAIEVYKKIRELM